MTAHDAHVEAMKVYSYMREKHTVLHYQVLYKICSEINMWEEHDIVMRELRVFEHIPYNPRISK